MRSAGHLFLAMILCGGLLVGCTTDAGQTTPPQTTYGETKSGQGVEDTALPKLLSYSVKSEGKDGEVLLLPNPVNLMANVSGTDLVIWRVVSPSGRDIQWLYPKKLESGEWGVEWGNPTPPPPTTVSLVLMAKVPKDHPNSASFKRMGDDWFVELAHLKVKSAW